MKILIVSEVFWPEEFIINDLASEWSKMGYEVEVLTQYPSYPQGYVFSGYNNKGYSVQDWNGIKIHRYPFVEGYRDSTLNKFLNYLYFIYGGKKIAAKLDEHYDCIFVSQSGPLTVAFPAMKLSKKYNVPMYIWTFDIWPDVVYSYGVPKCWLTDVILSWVIKRVYNSCNKIFVSSKRFKETIGRYTSKPILYAPNWLRYVCDEKSDLHLIADKFQFTFAGNISRYQNLINTVRGFAKANIPDTILNIIGDGSYADNVRKVVEELELENVIMYGRKPFNQIHDLLTQSDVLVLPLMANSGIEKTEPFKIQSYLRAGKPILGILNGSGKDIIEENNIGICSEPDNVDDIARGFREVMSFAQEYSNGVKKNAHDLMMERFNKDKIVKLITDVVSNVSKNE